MAALHCIVIVGGRATGFLVSVRNSCILADILKSASDQEGKKSEMGQASANFKKSKAVISVTAPEVLSVLSLHPANRSSGRMALRPGWAWRGLGAPRGHAVFSLLTALLDCPLSVMSLYRHA